MKFDIVIAQYRENLLWTKDLTHPSIRKIFVYTKWEPTTDLGSDKIIHSYLPNVGRESHTYLWHCVHYFQDMMEGNMSDFTFFVQGCPHAMNARRISDWINEIESSGLDFTLNYRLSSPYDFLGNGRCKSWAGETHPAEFDVKGWCDKYVEQNVDFKVVPIFWNACFGVSTRLILASERPRLARIQQKELNVLNPECGHYCERLWYHIFRMGPQVPAELPNGFWHFWGGPDGTRHYGVIKLLDNGQVGFYDNDNERAWERKGDSLILYSKDGKKTSVLKGSEEEGFSGAFLGRNKSLHRITRRIPIFG